MESGDRGKMSLLTINRAGCTAERKAEILYGLAEEILNPSPCPVVLPSGNPPAGILVLSHSIVDINYACSYVEPEPEVIP